MRLAIVIPVLDDATALAQLLPEATAMADEVYVVDGGSRDDSRAVAQRGGATVLRTPPGRGTQLNRGARATTAEVLVFLHADTRLPAGAAEAARTAVAGGAVGGGFCVRFDDPRPVFRLGSRIVSLRTRLLRLPLGDQAQFVSRTAFEALGGYQEWPILEDLDLMRRLKRLGPVAVVHQPVVTAARRFTANGIARTICRNWLIFALYYLGVEPRRLAHLYPPGGVRRA